MTTYTVVGLVDDDSGDLMVAGVFEGRLDAADARPYSAGYSRWAEHFTASSADEAEGMACELVRFGMDGDDLEGDES